MYSLSAQSEGPLFHIGLGGTYNADISQFAPHLRIDVPIFQDFEFSLQGNYFLGANSTPIDYKFHEYYIDANFNMYFYEYNTGNTYFDIYALAGYSYEHWFNSRNQDAFGNFYLVGPQSYHGFNLGVGARNYTNDYVSFFSDVRYYTNFREIALAAGIEFTFYGGGNRGPAIKQKKPKKYNYWDCPDW